MSLKMFRMMCLTAFAAIISPPVAADGITMKPDDLPALLLHLQDEIIALQIKVAALEQIVLTDEQRAQYEKVLKDETERALKLRTLNPGERAN